MRVDLKAKEIALKATWPRILNKETEYASIVYGQIDLCFGANIWRAYLRPEHVSLLQIGSAFWSDVLVIWCTANYWYDLDTRILVANKPFIWKAAYMRAYYLCGNYLKKAVGKMTTK